MDEIMETTIAYRFKEGIYLNITNRCPNLCSFCIKTKWVMEFDKFNLNLQGSEPSVQEILDAAHAEIAKGPYSDIVFCGYGEPTMRVEELKAVAKVLKAEMAEGKIQQANIRLNTVGLGNLIWKRNIVPELKDLVDIVYISLNSPDPQQWLEIVRPAKGFEGGYDSVIEFIKASVGNFKRVVVSTVDKLGVDTAKMKELVEGLGAEFYLRVFLEEND
ncbi:TatD family-associated radical SAM protein [Elusimicrobium posterum]|uniref:TatD family nuclease-associated radical SAM protein n=1 Tax=Elusimicrobium posterum TaxID=3116653 RepID=UPI003C72E133